MDICKEINMSPYGEPMFWIDNSDTPHLKGMSGVQFITTSNITVHTLDILEAVYVNIFSCKEFDASLAELFTKKFFGATESKATVIERI
jgi:S-adenosylmethionine/arginine decarboxylase-like enzyme